MIWSIQYLRGFAAMLVVWHHAKGQFPALEHALPWNFGTSGVDVFFVISGFIMAMTAKSLSPGEFVRKRLVRIVPMYWLVTLVMVAAAVVAPSLFRTIQPSFDHVALSLFFVPHWSPSFPGKAWPVLVPGWTLQLEIFFYALFAASMLSAHRYRWLLSTLALLVAAGIFLQPSSAAGRTYTDPLLVEFGLGVLIAISGRRLSKPAAMAAVLLGCLGLVLRETWGPVPQIAGAALLVLGSLSFDARSRFLKALGDASYSIYLSHLFTLGALRVVLRNPALFMPAALLLSATVGWLLHRYVEQPIAERLKLRKTEPRSTVAV